MLPASPVLADQSPRYHALDAVRAFALLLGVFYHGIASFVSYNKTEWPARDTQQSLWLDVLFYIVHVFRMPVFFLLAGFFAHLLYHRRGAWGFARNRVKRLLLPFCLFWPPLFLLVRQLYLWGFARLDHLPAPQALAKLPGFMRVANGLPLLHLWFLYLLLLFCAGVVLMRPLLTRWLDPAAQAQLRVVLDRWLAVGLSHWWGSLALGLLPLGPMLTMQGGFGVDTPISGLVPPAPTFAVYGLYFTVGWLLHRQPRLLASFSMFRQPNLGLSVLLIGALLLLNILYPSPSPYGRTLLNGLYAFASMTAVFAFVGYSIVCFSMPSARIRYLSDSAYWIYVVHLPVVVTFQLLVAPYSWFWLLKLLVVFVPSFSILFLSYQVVRHTGVGILLNGHRNG